MSANAGSVVVDVEGRLTGLDKSLIEADQRLDRFATDAERHTARLDRALTAGTPAGDAMLRKYDLKGPVDETIRLGNAVEQTQEKVADLEGAGDRAGSSLGRTAAMAAVAGVAAYSLGQNLQELGGEYERAGSAIQDLMSLNVVGFFKDVTSTVGPTTAELVKAGDAANALELANKFAAAGYDELAVAAREAARQIELTNAIQFQNQPFISTATGAVGQTPFGSHPNDRGGLQGPGGAAAIDFSNSPIGLTEPVVGLTQRLQTAIALAKASPGMKDDIAQLRRAADVLRGQLGQSGITDSDKEQIANSIRTINDELAALLKPKHGPKGPEAPIVPLALDIALSQAQLSKPIKDDLDALHQIEDYLTAKIRTETDLNRKLDEVNRLGQVRSQIAALGKSDTIVSDLFGGDFLNSAEFQRAQSFGYKPRGTDLLTDLQAQVRQGDQFASDLARLRQRGAGEGLIKSLAAGGQESAGLVGALAGSSPAVLRQYGHLFGRREQQAGGSEQLADTINIYVNSRTEAEGVKKGLRQAGYSYTRGK